MRVAGALGLVRVIPDAPRIIEALVTRDLKGLNPTYTDVRAVTRVARTPPKRGPKPWRESTFDIFTVLFTRLESRGPHV